MIPKYNPPEIKLGTKEKIVVIAVALALLYAISQAFKL